MTSPAFVYVAWRQPEGRRSFPVARVLRLNGKGLEFSYVHGARDAATFGFRPFLFAPRLDVVYLAPEKVAFLSNRLMSDRRPEYSTWLGAMGLRPGADAFDIFSRSGGLRATDDFEVYAPPEQDDAGELVYRFFARGLRYVEDVVDNVEARIARLQKGDPLAWRAENENPVDRFAISLHDGVDEKVGYVPYIMTEDFRTMTAGGVDPHLRVEQVNPRPIPLQQRLLVRMTVRPSHGFEPFGGERHRPIAAEASVVGSDLAPHG